MPDKPMPPTDDPPRRPAAVMPFGDHLEELRKRLIYALLGLLPIAAVTLVFGRRILDFIMRPIEDALAGAGVAGGLQVTSVFEYFNAYIKLSIILAVVVGAPWILYQVWKFVSPGLYSYERRFAYIVAPLSVLLTMLGAVFLYMVMLPVVLGFFVIFNQSLARPAPPRADVPAGIVLPTIPTLAADPTDPQPGQMWVNQRLNQLRIALAPASPAAAAGHAAGGPGGAGGSGEVGAATPTPAPAEKPQPKVLGVALATDALIAQQYKVSEYLSMVLGFALAFAVAFQMPVVVLLLGWVGIVTPGMLAKYRRHAVMACAVLGAVLTPADPISMFVLAIPLYMLFELGVILLRIMPAERVAGARGADADDGADAPPRDPGDREDRT
jgi:sec-independent protein translocase protein TatC